MKKSLASLGLSSREKLSQVWDGFFRTHSFLNFDSIQHFVLCNLDLQGSLRELMLSLSPQKNQEEIQQVQEVVDSLENLEKQKDPNQIRKSGEFSRLSRVC